MKLKFTNNLILSLCVLALVIICFLSIYSPMHFNEERAKREKAVIEQLVKIRNAENRYRAKNGIFTSDFNELKKYGLADSIEYIPFGDGKKFSIDITMGVGKSGREIPLMDCFAGYEEYLKGLDRNSINELMEKASANGTFPGLIFGDIQTDNNNAGNWE